MPMLSYSRNLEDVLLNRVFADISDGTYIDVGCFKPDDDSNTYALYARGWHGVCCDPIFNFEIDWPLQWQMLRPRDMLVRDAVGAEAGETRYFLCNYRGLSTCARDIVDSHVKVNGSHLSNEGSTVTVITLNRIIEKALDGKAPHLISIDVEGMEGAVLQGIDLERYRPWLFVIESYRSADGLPQYEPWEPMLTAFGYDAVYDDRINRFYLDSVNHGDLQRHFVYPANVWDSYKSIYQYRLERRLEEYESNRVLIR